jgi:superfamily II DNA/RNA helicase
VSFENLNLNSSILKALEDAGYTTPTPIQAQAIPEVMAGHDILASAQTGTGKTAAFILPALQRLNEASESKSRGPRVLVLTPTRELALQVTEAASKYSKHMRRIKVVSILGGMPYPLQNKLLSQPIDILVATPGRLIDHLQRGRVEFSRLEMLILDEADRMLDMGFSEDVDTVCAATPASRQTLMFSATFEGNIAKLAQRLLKTPKRIEVAHQQAKHESIEQRLHYVDDMSHKNKLLQHLLSDVDLKQAIVFTATKRDADLLADELFAQGHEAAALHGDMNQGARTRTLTKMRRGGIRVLVATDVAARGLDVPGISHVINYDLPKAAEDYVHRIGRTGRAGATGIAVSFASPRDRINLSKIERFTGQRIEAHVVPGLEPKRSSSSSAPKVTHRKSGPYDNNRGNSSRGNAGAPGRSAAPGRSTGGYAGNRNEGGYAGRNGRPDTRSAQGNGPRREANGNTTRSSSGDKKTPFLFG